MVQEESSASKLQPDVLNDGLMEIIENEMQNRKRKTKRNYSAKIRAFSFTVYYYSPKVYRYLRTVFTLPAPRTIQRWLETVNCEPGFLIDVIKSAASQTQLYSLAFDSMSIRKRLCVTGDKVSGWCDFGNGLAAGENEKSMATEALVFLLVPLFKNVRYPIGFFFIDKISATMQSQLIEQCLKLTAEHSIKIVNITCDGCPANITTLKQLGSEIPRCPKFKHPIYDYYVTATLDPPHMLKLCRNTFAELRVLKSDDGVIDYKYIEQLIAYQDKLGLRLGNKLGKKHLDWRNMKMKVQLAAQLLSSSVADALTYLIEIDENFKEALPTVIFIRHIDKLFDILNSHSPYGKYSKSPITRSNIKAKEKTLEEIIQYLYKLRLSNDQLVCESRRKCFILGFAAASHSLITLSKRLFEEIAEVKYMLAYKLGQDHLETLFSKIRSKNGHNNNPDVVQFKSALKSLLVKTDVTPSSNANCLELDTGSQLLLAPKASTKPSTEDFTSSSEDASVVDYSMPKSLTDTVEYISKSKPKVSSL